MKTLLIIIAGVIALGVFLSEANEEQLIIPTESLRLRIVPNSNRQEDIEVKSLLKKLLGNNLEESLKNSQTLEESKNIIRNDLENIESIVSEALRPLNMAYQINLGQNYFPAKNFKGITYQAGMYESLVVTIEKGEGDNWWCVLFPPLCSLKRDTELEEVEYQFFVSRIINKFR